MVDVANIEGKLRCLRRELKLREKTYPRWVAEGRMAAAQAGYELDTLRQVVEDYSKLAEEKEPTLKLC